MNQQASLRFVQSKPFRSAGPASWLALGFALAATGCGGDDEPAGSGGTAGTAGTAGSGGSAGAGGTAGVGGSGASGGTAGTGGSAGGAGTAGAAGSAGTGGTGGQAAEANARLIVADSVENKVKVIELTNGSIIRAFDTTSPATALYTTSSGRFAAVVQSASHRVDFLDSGLYLEAHGDHFDEEKQAPQMSAMSLVGSEQGAQNPVHFIAHHGWITLHFDGVFDAADPTQNVNAKNFIFEEAQLLEAAPSVHLTLESAKQHGLAMVTEQERVVFTEPAANPADLPTGFSVRDLNDGSVLQTIHDVNEFTESCIGMHGEAMVDGKLLFGCHQQDGGVMVIEWNESAMRYDSRKITYPGYPAAPKRTSVLKSHAENTFAVGQWGVFGANGSEYNSLVRINPAATAIVEADVLELGSVYCGFDFEQHHGETVVALTRDGKLHFVDLVGWSVTGTLDVVPDGGDACLGVLAVGEDFAYVSEAATGTVHEINIATRSLSRSLNVGGSPTALSVFGWRGAEEHSH